MNKYAVFTKIALAGGETVDIMVTGVEATSPAAAEHKLLDGFATVTNATAYDLSTQAEYAAPYFANSRIYDFADFATHCRRREDHLQEFIDTTLEEVEVIKAEITAKTEQLYSLERQIEALKVEIDTNKDEIKEMIDYLNDTCRAVNMRPEHSPEFVQGIA